jgi:5'(3')-deoxyribonucleotidase
MTLNIIPPPYYPTKFSPGRSSRPVPSLGQAKPVLSVDLDNVIRDQIGSIITATWQRHGVRLSRDLFHSWDPPLGHLVGLSDEAFTAWAWTDPLIFATARPMEDAPGALRSLGRDYRIVITTSTHHPDLTRPWLNYWRIPYDEIIHTPHKYEVEFDLHLDDSPLVLADLQRRGRPGAIRFALPWNRHLVNLPTLTGWAAWREVLS